MPAESNDMEQEVRELLRSMADDVPVPQRVSRPAVLHARRRLARTGAAAGVAALLLAFGVVVGIRTLRLNESPRPVTSPSPSPGAGGAVRLSWSMARTGPYVFAGARIHGVSAGGTGDVAVGSRGADAAAWTSANGISWQAATGALGGPGSQVMTDVVAGGPGLVAVGFDGLDGAVWTSVDGTAWSKVPTNPSVFTGVGASKILGVAVGGPGLVAVGHVGIDAAVWTSPDGLHWSRAGDPGRLKHAVMYDVTAGGPGLVAVGTQGIDIDAAVWTSPDGVRWTRIRDDASIFGGRSKQVMDAVTAVGWEGVVANGRSRAAVWTSIDGITWTRVPPAQASLVEGSPAMYDVVSIGASLVAVGVGHGARGEAAAWTSADGTIWSRVSVAAAVFGSNVPSDSMELSAVVPNGAGLIAVGDTPTFDARLRYDGGLVWMAKPAR